MMRGITGTSSGGTQPSVQAITQLATLAGGMKTSVAPLKVQNTGPSDSSPLSGGAGEWGEVTPIDY